MNPSFAHFRFPLLVVFLICALGACASLPPPTQELSSAQQAVTRADGADAAQHAPDQLATAREALEKANIQASAVRAVGITNQRETTVVWNRRTGQPIYNAIVWQDRRAEPTCAALREQGYEAQVLQKTGLRIDAYFSGTKLAWLLDSERMIIVDVAVHLFDLARFFMGSFRLQSHPAASSSAARWPRP